MSKCTSMRHFAAAIGAASVSLLLSGAVMAQITQQPATTAPAPTTTTPATPSMPMQQMEHGGHGMGMSGQGHQGMMGGQGQHTMPMGSMPQCPPGQTASGNPPTCR
jgi:hypothetical protein